MKRNGSAAGVTLLELVVASAMMGILFFSGLQLLSTVSAAHGRLMKGENSVQVEQLRLEAQLRLLLQDARELELTQNGRSLDFKNAAGEQTLAFRRKSRWMLLWNDVPLATWHASTREKAFRFAIDARLLRVTLSEPQTPLSIWLRNR